MSTRRLAEEIRDLKKDFDEVREYSLKLQEQGKRKWGSSFESEIATKSIIGALDNLLLVQIEKGRLREAERDDSFQKALMEIIQDVERKNPKLVPTSLATKSHLRFELDKEEDRYHERRKLGYAISISSKILNQIMACETSLQEDIVRVTVKELPFLAKCQVSNTQEMTTGEIAKVITEAINDLIEERLEILGYIAIFFPNLYEMYFAEINWASRIVDRHMSPSTGRYSLIKENEASISIPPYVSILLITETRRLVNGIIVDANQVDHNK